MTKNYKVVYSESHSRQLGDDRYIVIDSRTGEILDTASEWGYRSEENARRAYEWKLAHPEPKPKTKEELDEMEETRLINQARNFYTQHPQIFEDLLNATSFPPDSHIILNDDGSQSVIIMDGTGEDRADFTPEEVAKILYANGYEEKDLPFSAEILYKSYMKYDY